jgi:hypothetical protein
LASVSSRASKKNPIKNLKICTYYFEWSTTNFKETTMIDRGLASLEESGVPDPHVFGPPGSESTRQRHGSRSGSFYHQTKLLRKSSIPTVVITFGLISNFFSSFLLAS